MENSYKSRGNLVHYASNWLDAETFIATYRGSPVLKITSRIMGKTIAINTNGFHTQTTVRALNKAFKDAKLPWRATTSGARMFANRHSAYTTIITEDNTHQLGDVEYTIMI